MPCYFRSLFNIGGIDRQIKRRRMGIGFEMGLGLEMSQQYPGRMNIPDPAMIIIIIRVVRTAITCRRLGVSLLTSDSISSSSPLNNVFDVHTGIRGQSIILETFCSQSDHDATSCNHHSNGYTATSPGDVATHQAFSNSSTFSPYLDQSHIRRPHLSCVCANGAAYSTPCACTSPGRRVLHCIPGWLSLLSTHASQRDALYRRVCARIASILEPCTILT